MRYDLDQLETLLTVLELGTVTAAAAQLNLSKSVVSKRVTDLELELGAPLFRRNAGRLTPTDAAHRLAEGIRPALADLRAATEAVGWGGDRQIRGALSIAVPVSFGTLHLSPILARFARAHPGLTLQIDYDDRFTDLGRGGYDLAIRIGPLANSALMAKKLCEDVSMPCAAPALLDRVGRPATPADLTGQKVIGYAHMSNADLWRFGRLHPAVTETISVNNGEAMRDLAIAGVGFAMLPGFIAEPAIAAGLLEHVLPDIPARSLPIHAVWPPAHPVPAKLRALIDHLSAELSEGAPWRAGAQRGG